MARDWFVRFLSNPAFWRTRAPVHTAVANRASSARVLIHSRVRGLMAFIAGLVYAIPGIVVGCMLAFAGGLLGNSSLGGTLFLCLSCCLGAFLILYGIVAAALFWMGVIRYAESGNFSEFLQFSDLWEDVRSNWGILLSLLLYSLVLGMLAGVVGLFSVVLCGVGEFIVIFYTQVVSGHLVGQAGLEIAHDY